jgi:hypothetical protein
VFNAPIGVCVHLGSCIFEQKLIKQKGEEHLSQKENHIFILSCLKKGGIFHPCFIRQGGSSSQQKVKENGGVLCTITIRSFGFAFPKPVATKSLKLWAHIKLSVQELH